MSAGRSSSGWWETIKIVIEALVIAMVVRVFFYQPFNIPSGSMKDTLLVGDYLFVSKLSYGYSKYSFTSSIDLFDGRIFADEPKRGDVIVFKLPRDNSTDYIKRLIGLPGDTVQMREGRLFINGTPVEVRDDGTFEEVAAPQGPQGLRPRCENGPVGMGAVCTKSRQIETLPGGTEHGILNITRQGSDDTPVYTVPSGHYFFMGDNRDNSTDSRVPPQAGGVGFVPYENLIGRADRIMFSSAGRSMLFFWTWRSDRYFKAVE